MRFGLPRSLAVFIVYGLFAVAIASTAVIVATVVADQVSSVSSIVEEEFNTPAGRRRDAGRGAHRPPAGLARLPRPGAGQGARPGEPGDRPDPLDRSPGVHRQGGRHRPGRGDRRVREPVQRRAGDRHLDLHAARRRPAVPVPAQPLPRRRPVRRSDRPVREGADRVRPRAGHGVAGDRGDRGRRLLDPGRAGHLRERRRLRHRLRRVGGGDRGDPVRRPLAGRDPAVRRRADPVADGGASRWRCCSCSSTRSRATSSSPS